MGRHPPAVPGGGRSDRRPPGRPRRDPSDDKYAALCEKYRALVQKYEATAGRTSSAAVLALAAMRAGTTALAAIHSGRCLVRNGRWLQLASARGAPWRVEGADGAAGRAGGREFETLEALALAAAEELGECTRVLRCERAGGGVFAELRLDRTQLGDPVVLAMISDVSERVRSERELARMREAMEAQERLRAVGELASGIAHDLNNTLHALRLRLSRLAGCVAGCAEHEEDLRVVERIASDAGARVRRLQDLARRREDAPGERVALGPLIADAVAVARLDRGDPGRRVKIALALPPLPPVLADGPELAHVFVNLFLNANDAMPQGGTITVTGATGPAGDVEIAVADEGGGIPAENLERVFDPFFTTKGRRGTGLGLSMAAGLMRRFGGSIRAGNGPHGGAVFTLRFPPAPPAPAPAQAPPRKPAEPRHHRVLVVDDDPDNLDAMRLVLEQHGHHVEVTASGLDAVSRVEAGQRYDTVLCDLGLGDATGWEVAARIGAIAPATRILLVTGWAEEIPPDDPRRAHVARVLSKPLGIDDLREILAEAPLPAAPHDPRAPGPGALHGGGGPPGGRLTPGAPPRGAEPPR